jgi:hypothetical protein
MRLSPRAVAAGVALVALVAVAIAFQPTRDEGTVDSSLTSFYRSEPELLPAGGYVADQVFDGRIAFDVPANWTSLEHKRGVAFLLKTVDARPVWTVDNTVVLGIYAVDRVYQDPCRDRDPATGAPPTLLGFVAGLTHAVGYEAGPIEDTTVGGRPATVFDLRNKIDDAECRSEHFSQWTFRTESGVGQGNGSSTAGTHQRIWLVDVDGTVILINADSGEDSYAEDVEELYQIVESIRFE